MACMAQVLAACWALGTLTASPAWGQSGGSWVVTSSKDEMDDSQDFGLALRGERISGSMGSYEPSLFIICRAKESAPRVAVILKEVVDAEITESGGWTLAVRTRLDEGPVKSERWSATKDLTSVFSPRSWTRIRAIEKGSRLRIEIPRHLSSSVVARFDVGGLGDHLAELGKHCPAR